MNELSSLLREQRDAIVAEWLRQVREQLPAAEGMPGPVLENNVPQIILELAERVESRSPQKGLDALPTLHALDRYRIGFDVRAVLSEYAILRQVILARIPAAAEPGEIASLHQMLDRAIADAVDHYALERDRAREIFVGMLGHDLRNPLNAIAMASQQLLLHPEHLDPVHRRLVVRIQSSATRIERMADDLLDFTRGRIGGGVPLTIKPVDLAGIVNDVVDEFREAFPDREVRAEPGPGDLDGEWDGDRLAQVVSNLIANALEHGGDPIVVRARPDGDTVTIEVENQGEMPEHLGSRVFDPFVSLHATRSGRRGLGLGLYIVREIARAHGGSVEAVSSRGATFFRVVLPRRVQATAP